MELYNQSLLLQSYSSAISKEEEYQVCASVLSMSYKLKGGSVLDLG